MMLIKIFLTIVIFFMYYLGNHFGVSLYYYLDRGVFQSSLRDLGTPPMLKIAAGASSSLFTLMVVILYYMVAKKRIVRHYIISIMTIYIVQFIIEWKLIADFDLHAIDAVVSALFVNIEFVTFCITSYLMLKILKNLDYLN